VRGSLGLSAQKIKGWERILAGVDSSAQYEPKPRSSLSQREVCGVRELAPAVCGEACLAVGAFRRAGTRKNGGKPPHSTGGGEARCPNGGSAAKVFAGHGMPCPYGRKPPPRWRRYKRNLAALKRAATRGGASEEDLARGLESCYKPVAFVALMSKSA